MKYRRQRPPRPEDITADLVRTRHPEPATDDDITVARCLRDLHAATRKAGETYAVFVPESVWPRFQVEASVVRGFRLRVERSDMTPPGILVVSVAAPR